MADAPGTKSLPQRVFQRLDDRHFQSGEALAEDLSVTRAAVWKAVEQLRELGVQLDAQTSKGYRLAPGVSALVAERITARFSPELRARIETLQVEWSLESTNTQLLESPRRPRVRPRCCSPSTNGAGAGAHGAAGDGSRRRAGQSACRWRGSTRKCRRIFPRSAW
jgi:biotin operon repressor BirA-like protein